MRYILWFRKPNLVEHLFTTQLTLVNYVFNFNLETPINFLVKSTA